MLLDGIDGLDDDDDDDDDEVVLHLPWSSSSRLRISCRMIEEKAFIWSQSRAWPVSMAVAMREICECSDCRFVDALTVADWRR